MFKDVPKNILFISLLGLIPLIVGSILSFKIKIFPQKESELLIKISLQYGAFILCFMSGCVFFCCINAREKTNYLWLSIIPIGLSVIALNFPLVTGFILALGFLYLLEIERKLYKLQLTPVWWVTLRMPMTFFVLINLIIIGFNI